MKKEMNGFNLILFILFIVILIILAIIYVFFINFKQQTPVQTAENIKQVCFKQVDLPINKCFSVEVAQTAVEREKGLMFREELGQDKGMLFIFPKAEKYGFWMKNTLIPLDIIWIDENKTVVDIKKDVQPCRANNSDNCPVYVPDKEAIYVLEINSGLSEENNLSVEDEVNLIS